MTTDTVFAEDLSTALAALDVDTELVRVAWAEIHEDLRHINIYSSLLCSVGTCRGNVNRRGAIRVFGYAPEMRTVPVCDCGQHDAEQVAHAIAVMIEDGERQVESRANYPELWFEPTTARWIGYRWRAFGSLGSM